jgi:adenylyl-sulfate kinase
MVRKDVLAVAVELATRAGDRRAPTRADTPREDCPIQCIETPPRPRRGPPGGECGSEVEGTMRAVSEWNRAPLSTAEREVLSGHRGAVVWFTGLSGSGKSTVARWLEHRLHRRAAHTFLLDADAVRRRLNADLGFSADDRRENLRRVTEVARLFADAGVLAVVAAITPYEAVRERARETIGAERFVLVHMATPLEVCEARDPKGLYARARAGEIPQFTGIDAPYEEPSRFDLRICPEDGDPDQAVARILDILEGRGLLERTI